jgi:hypothetical protein
VLDCGLNFLPAVFDSAIFDFVALEVGPVDTDLGVYNLLLPRHMLVGLYENENLHLKPGCILDL